MRNKRISINKKILIRVFKKNSEIKLIYLKPELVIMIKKKQQVG